MLSGGVEIGRVEPALEGRLERQPLAVEDREPAGIAVARFVDRRLVEHALVAEPEALRRGARRRVERIAFPFVAPIAELVKDAAHHQVHRLGRRRGALQRRGVVDAADLDDPRRGVDAHQAGDTDRTPAAALDDDVAKRVVAEAVPPGLGAPIYAKLDAELAAALMGINAVKGVEIGAGFAAAELSGEDNADEMRMGNDGKPAFLSNHAGGILGGISTGQPVVARFAVKPTSSILNPRRTVDRYGRETDISTTGRHDPCVGIRAVPIGEAMVACVIADHYLRQRGQVGETPAWPFMPRKS